MTRSTLALEAPGRADFRIGAIGIRAARAGALTGAIDRELTTENPIAADFRRAAT